MEIFSRWSEDYWRWSEVQIQRLDLYVGYVAAIETGLCSSSLDTEGKKCTIFWQKPEIPGSRSDCALAAQNRSGTFSQIIHKHFLI